MSGKRPLELGSVEFDRYVAENIEALWLQQVRWKARIGALSHVIDVLIATHPKPEAAQLLLNQARPELVDELVSGEANSEFAEAGREQWARDLAHFEELLHAVIQRRKDDE